MDGKPSRHAQSRGLLAALLFALEPPADLGDDLQMLQSIREEFVASGSERIPEPDISLRLGPVWDETATQLGLADCAT